MTIYDDVLFDYQKIAAQRIFKQRKVLLADQPGLGKTLEVIAALELDGLLDKPSNILILTPIINAQTTWRDSIVRWVQAKYPSVSLIDASKGSAAKKSAQFKQTFPDGPVIVLANHDALSRVPEILSTPYDAVIVDESHLVLPITGAKPTKFWQALSQVRFSANALRIAVSGTPDRGKLENRYGTYTFLGIASGSRWAWLEKNFYVVEQRVSRTRTIKATQGLKSKEDWIATDAKVMIRRTKSEVLTQLPPKRYVDVELELGSAQRTAYFAQQMVSERKILEARIDGTNTAEAMVFSLRARQISSCMWQEKDGAVVPLVGGQSAKLDWLLEWLDERGFIEQDAMADNSAKVVIVSQFSKVLHWLKEELNGRHISCAVLDGNVSDNARNTIQREFQVGSLRIVLLSGSMGVGINLDAADDLVMLDLPYDPDKVEQIEDRVHRASNMHHVTIWNLIAVDTIDQAIIEKVSKRYQTTRQLMDGSRGIDFARKVVDIITKEK